MNRNIRLLDCTLRDGGHVVQGNFGKDIIKNVIKKLVESNVDIIEVGFLWESQCDINIARYYSISDVKKILPKELGNSKLSLMADYIDLQHLEPYDGTVEYIRLSFKRWRLDWGLKTAQILMNKGYKVILNPVNNNVYTDKEYIDVLEKINKLHPYGFSIVDTFGVMRINDLTHRYFLVENNLDRDITIGIHLHENLGMAYSLAQQITKIANPKRNIIIDGSLLGMGRTPGNLCIEHIMDYMNEQFGYTYTLDSVYDAIDEYIAPLKKKYQWGYAIPYALSAKYYLHRTYAEYLSEKQRLKTKDIQRILAKIEPDQAETFNEEYVEELYRKYMNVSYVDSEDINNLSQDISEYKKFLIIAPGSSIIGKEAAIVEKNNKETCVIAVNFIPEIPELKVDYLFLTNIKRYDNVYDKEFSKIIITSNLLRDIVNADYTISYNESVYFDGEYCDDSTLMLINLLHRMGKSNIIIAGFDGRRSERLDFVNQFIFDSNVEKNFGERNNIIKKILSNKFGRMNISFLTDSEYIV